MITITVLIILICSLIGMVVILFRKIPLLVALPETSAAQFSWRNLLLSIQNKIKTSPPFKGFSPEIFLQKILSKIRILTLKTDNKTSNWLQKLREKSQKNKFGENDNYWKEIRRSTKK